MVDSCCWVSLHPEELLNAKMSHTAKTRPIADLMPAHYCPAEEEAGLWIAALGGSFWLLQICLQACNSGLSIVAHFSVPILVDVLAAVELLLSAKLAIRYIQNNVLASQLRFWESSGLQIISLYSQMCLYCWGKKIVFTV